LVGLPAQAVKPASPGKKLSEPMPGVVFGPLEAIAVPVVRTTPLLIPSPTPGVAVKEPRPVNAQLQTGELIAALEVSTRIIARSIAESPGVTVSWALVFWRRNKESRMLNEIELRRGFTIIFSVYKVNVINTGT
jgi:hypothetical protein